MLKVAIVTPKISHFEVPLFRLAASFEGIDLRVFHNDSRGDSFHDVDYGTTIDWGEQLRGGYPNTAFPTLAELKGALLDWSPGVALQYGYFWKGALPFLAHLRFARIPVVHRGLLTTYYNTRQHPLVTRTWRMVQPALLKRFQGHHYGGTYSEAVLERCGISKSQRFFVPFSIDTSYFAACADDPAQIAAAAEIRRGLGWSADDPVLLFMCQHSWFKAPDVMLRIAAEAQRRRPATKLIMAGSGAMTDELKTFAASKLAPGSFHFPGYVSSKLTMPIYLASDLVLFPSRYDTWSRGVNEAMLARRPCIVSRVVPAAGGLVDHGENGYVVDGLEPAAFVDLIEQFRSLPSERRAAMGQTARERAKYFSYEVHASELRASLVQTAARFGAAKVVQDA